MLDHFLITHRAELVRRCRDKVARRNTTGQPVPELAHGVSAFLEQLIKTLRMEQGPEPELGLKVSGPATGVPAMSEVGESASLHGGELRDHGYTIEAVVHEYGDLCQAITDLAFDLDEPITTAEFRTLNRCLDNAMATAVTEFTYVRERATAEANRLALNVRLGEFAHELRNSLSNATLAVAAIRAGHVGISGATGAVLDRSLVQMRNLIDRSLAEARLDSGLIVDSAVFPLAEFIAEARLAASLEANLRERLLVVSAVDPTLAIAGDRDLLMGALGNLLQNAFKFSPVGGEVTLSAYAAGDHIRIDVEDSCGGLGPGVAEAMFRPFAQLAEDRSGLGLGLSIARRGVEASGGTLTVLDRPGVGCVMTIGLPRRACPQPASRAVPAPVDAQTA
jgi:signal transduction histidine kinase